MYYVNLPIRFIAEETPYLDRFLAYGRERAANPAAGPELGLELGLDAHAMDELPLSWHRELAARLRDQGVGLAMHLPFRDLAPASVDPLIRQASRERLAASLELAQVYAPAHMVAHPIYDAEAWGHEPVRWAECGAGFWAGLLDAWPGHPPLFLENIFEQHPEPLALLLHALDGRDAGICFDVGHWHSYSRGGLRANLDLWVASLAPFIRHLHLHDNDGAGDQHKGMGKGEIDFALLFSLLAEHGCRPGVTFEPHCEEAFFETLQFVAAHPGLFGALAPEGRG